MAQDRTLLIIGIIALIAATLSLIVSIGGIDLTGYQTTNTSSGNATLEVTQRLEVNFTTNSIDWGSGRVDQGKNAATLNSEGTVTNSTVDAWNTVNTGLILENLGNINATVNLTAGSSASSFIGGGAASDAPSPEYKWKTLDNQESVACVSASPASYTTVSTSSPGTKICDPLKYKNSNDEVEINIQVVVPYDAPVESKTDTITATATAA